MIKKFSIFLAFGLAITLPSAYATTLAPGQTAAPDVFTNATSTYTFLASISGTINPVPGTSFNATYVEEVAKDPNNTFCANCITFLIGMNNKGPGIVERVSTSAFDNFLTDAGVNTAMSSTGAVAPTSVDRSINGNVVGFNFIPPGQAVSGAQNSMVLEIMTNATSYVPGFVSIQDGQAGTGPGFQPASATPEPVSMTLLGGGLALLGLARWRRPSKKV